MTDLYSFQEHKEVNYKNIILLVLAVSIPVVISLFYFGIIPLDFNKTIEQPMEVPVIDEPNQEEVPEVITEVSENPIFIESNKEGLLPTTPQITDNTPDVESLEPTTPQNTQPNIVNKVGNLDDIKPEFRRFLETYPISTIEYLQNLPCSKLPNLAENETISYADIINVKAC